MTEELLDAPAITVTHVLTSSDLRSARVFVSILGHEEERAQLLRELVAHRIELQNHIIRTVRLKYTPKLTFQLDTSLEEGDRVLELLKKLNKSTPPEEPHDEANN
jgi:ribosome-binding factor A